MSSVGLLYVGAVLFVDGLMLLGLVPTRAAAPLNLFVGALQCIVPTVILIQANGDAALILGASGLYLFGFTYLYVGINNLADLQPQGLGWFSLFVAGAAIAYSIISFTIVNDPVFGVIWLSWAVLWFLFFLLLGLQLEQLTGFTAWTTVLFSQPTCTVPAVLIMTGKYQPSVSNAAIWGAVLLLLLVVARLLGARYRTEEPQTVTAQPQAA